MAWTFLLHIKNDTDRELEVVQSQLHWGYWNTDNQENNGPKNILPGETVQAVGVNASFGPNGYEFSCSWKDKTPKGELPYGVLSLSVDVPHRGSNKAACKTTGQLKITGWENIPDDGHDFVRSITISMPKKQEKMFFRGDIRNWNEVEKVKEIDVFDMNQCIPETMAIERRWVGRTSVSEIPKRLWEAIKDPVYSSMYSKNISVKKYFCLAIYSVEADTKKIESLGAGGKTTVTNEMETITSSKRSLETVMSLESSISSTSKMGASKTLEVLTASAEQELSVNLTSKFEMTYAVEDSTEQKVRDTREQTFEAPPDKSLIIVPWIFSKNALLYREDIHGEVELVGASEWKLAKIHYSYHK
ncbi:hypothetical protein [Aneurinibacillus sp. REN35]|uniref:hypothetical protein n=1 Tax=Aneurinibacillus sp. REN35 TaxID=3237286 RepID=UPI003527F65C